MTKFFRNNKIFATLLVLCVVMPLVAREKEAADDLGVPSLFPAQKKEISDADRRKAEYVYLEADRSLTEGNQAQWFELMRYARTLDPENTAAAYNLALGVMRQGTSDKAMTLAERLMREHFNEDRSDLNESTLYGYIAQSVLGAKEAVAVWKQLNDEHPGNEEVLAPLAELYTATGEYGKAIELYDTLENIYGKALPISAKKVMIYTTLHDTVKCINECQSLLATAPENIDYLIFVGDVYYFLQKPDSVNLYYGKAQELEPDNGEIYLKRAQIYRAEGDTVNYDNQVYKALMCKGMDVAQKHDALLEYSADLVQSQDSSERAQVLFRAILEEHPHEYSIRKLFADYLWTIKDYSGAAEQLSYALDIEPINPDEWLMLAYCYTRIEDEEKSQEAAEKGLKYNPDDLSLMRYNGVCLFQLKRYDEALEQYDAAISKADAADAEMLASLYTLKGDTYYSLGDTAKVWHMYDKALEYNPTDVGTLNNYAYYLAETGGDLDKAEKMSYNTIVAEPENPTYLDTYAWILFCKANYKEALVYMEKAVEQCKVQEDYKLDATILEHYGDVLFMNGKPEDALVLWESALEMDGDKEILKRKVEHKTYFFK